MGTVPNPQKMEFKVERIVFSVFIFLLILVLSKLSQHGRDPLRIVKKTNEPLYDTNFKKSVDYFRRKDFPKPMKSWFESHKFNSTIPLLHKYRPKPDSVFQRRWRDADVGNYGVLNRGIDVNGETKFRTTEHQDEFKPNSSNINSTDLPAIEFPFSETCKIPESKTARTPITWKFCLLHPSSYAFIMRRGRR